MPGIHFGRVMRLRRAWLGCFASVLVLAGAPSSVIPQTAHAATLADLGKRLPNGKLVWSRNGRLFYSTIANFEATPVTYLDSTSRAQPVVGDGPKWSPDGTQLLYVDPSGVQVMSASFPSRRQLVIKYGHTASWTRDGKAITAIAGEGTCKDYCVLRYTLSTQSTTTIFDSRQAPYHGDKISQAAELRTGGRFLLTFRAPNSSDHHTEIIDLEHKKVYANAVMLGGDCSPAWAPDGSFLVHTSRESSRPIRRTIFDAGGPSVSSTASYFFKLPTSSRYYIHNGHVSNDGQWVLGAAKYLSGGHSDRELYIRHIKDAVDAVVRLTTHSADDISPSLYVGGASVSEPKLSLSPTTLSFSAQQGGVAPTSKKVTATYADGATPSSQIPQIKYAGSASGWLAVKVDGSGSTRTLTNTVSHAGLAPNNYSATVQVFADGAANSPQTYVVTLTVTRPPDPPPPADAGAGDAGAAPDTGVVPDVQIVPTMSLTPSQVTFTVQATVDSPPRQDVIVALQPNGIFTAADLGLSVQYAGNGGWLEVSAKASGDSILISNQVTHHGLTANRYVATVSVAAIGLEAQAYVVVLEVTDGPPIDAEDRPGTEEPPADPASDVDLDACVACSDAGMDSGNTTTAGVNELEPSSGWLVGGCSLTQSSASGVALVVLIVCLFAVPVARRTRGSRRS